nr:MAG TPA_asm: RecT protein [Caudoviricetes sp.]
MTTEQQQGKQTLENFLEVMRPSLEKVLPAFITPEKITRVVVGEYRQSDDLKQCSFESIGAALLKAAEIGLQPSSTLGHCYILPFNNKQNDGTWGKEAQLVIGYKGYIVLAQRSGIKLHAREVCENDYFDYMEGTDSYLHHKPLLNGRGKVIAYYAIATDRAGDTRFSLMGKEAIEKHAKANSKSFDKKSGSFRGPWAKHFDSMAKKTVIKDHMTFIPLDQKQPEEIEEQQEPQQQPQQIKPQQPERVIAPPPEREPSQLDKVFAKKSDFLAGLDRFGESEDPQTLGGSRRW